ncbi:hypothetical protein Acr_09g0004310 [Actinidia rufa]|uniref:Reverse transcriptase zinc-binding domain-containing protein n=1 Tax=Actinidia rufa TaxID=165716 RepID=A0A7J0F5J8_9ERIC|nr:hypothetical protein Acr_09g0004310 [Actinidia rufa]
MVTVRIEFWKSHHNTSPLIEHFEDRFLNDCNLPNAKLENLILGNSWRWPSANSQQMMELIASTPYDLSPIDSNNDVALWIQSSSGSFSINSAWDLWRQRKPIVEWRYLIWFPGHVPRWSVIAWLAIKERLSTRDRIIREGMGGDPICILCTNDLESHDHIFFNCPFSTEVWGNILSKCGMSWERNRRIFQNSSCSSKILEGIIVVSLRSLVIAEVHEVLEV